MTKGLNALFDPKHPGLGWLFPREIHAALSHLGFKGADLSLETSLVLEMMAYLTEDDSINYWSDDAIFYANPRRWPA